MTVEEFFTAEEVKEGVTNGERVRELVSMMEREGGCMEVKQKSMVADVIAGTDSRDCLNLFVELEGLSHLERWMEDDGAKEASPSITRAVEKLHKRNEEGCGEEGGLVCRSPAEEAARGGGGAEQEEKLTAVVTGSRGVCGFDLNEDVFAGGGGVEGTGMHIDLNVAEELGGDSESESEEEEDDEERSDRMNLDLNRSSDEGEDLGREGASGNAFIDLNDGGGSGDTVISLMGKRLVVKATTATTTTTNAATAANSRICGKRKEPDLL